MKPVTFSCTTTSRDTITVEPPESPGYDTDIVVRIHLTPSSCTDAGRDYGAPLFLSMDDVRALRKALKRAEREARG